MTGDSSPTLAALLGVGTCAVGAVLAVAASAPAVPARAADPPRGARDQHLDFTAILSYAAAHHSTVLEIAMLRPSATQVVAYAITLGDPAPVRAALRRAYGARLCVARSRYSRVQVDRAYGAFLRGSPERRESGVYSVGRGLSRQGQVLIEVEATTVSPDLARLAARRTAGLVDLRRWLHPS